ncbi:hypothetical protein Nos7524_1467 [Nostoc sp. PCC 7524]|uniref:hypothetical protein n=1 Tax=Nostoc sp. (strain ATCC 29411 / PCC 7524) TaxID=28072 RepID=UPI00029F4A23|nr:hypothetical protein [Nostoc sp. PCC 7524]AFY47345.1 hypothetical protein Nos7524_1467 [Nostoc sp. PCC 7524]
MAGVTKVEIKESVEELHELLLKQKTASSFERIQGSWQLLVILVGGRQRAEGRRQKLERYN